MSDSSSVAHSNWDCTYHIVFIPKYRRKVMFGDVRKDVGEILRKLCEYKGVELVKGSVGVDHIHMMVRIPPKYAVSDFMGYLKGKSALMIFDRHPEFKTSGGRRFWARGYYVSTIGLNEEVIREYIKNQLEADILEDKAMR